MTHVEIAADDQAEDRGVDAEEDLELHGAGILCQRWPAAGRRGQQKSAPPAASASRVTQRAGAEQRLAVAQLEAVLAGRAARTPSWQAAVG